MREWGEVESSEGSNCHEIEGDCLVLGVGGGLEEEGEEEDAAVVVAVVLGAADSSKIPSQPALMFKGARIPHRN